ncbi:MAG: DUF58 domain-containing protein [Gammaproteobacteria bacterium]
MTRQRPLDPTTLARIRDLKLLARVVVDGALHGIHTSRQRGEGMEFSEYRQYEPGDDPRQIDWKLYARSDKVFVRQSERESHVPVWIIVDTSASMAQPSADVSDWTRLDCARALAASLAYVCQQQGDAFGLLSLNDTNRSYLPCRDDDRQLDRFVAALNRLDAQGQWPNTTQLDALWDQLQGPGLVVVISDFLQDSHEIEQLLGKLAGQRKEVLTLQLLTREEVTFPYHGNIAFRDRETNEQVFADAASVRERYLGALKRARRHWIATLAGLNIQDFLTLIEEPLDDTLRHFLKHRRRFDRSLLRETH